MSDWGLYPRGGLGSILQAYQQGAQFKQQQADEAQRQQQITNQDLENTGKFGAEFGAVPNYGDHNNFLGYTAPTNAGDLARAKAQNNTNMGYTPDRPPVQALANTLNPSGPAVSVSTPDQVTPSGRPLAAPGQLSFVDSATGPTPSPGGPEPLARDPKIDHEKAKAILNQDPTAAPIAPPTRMATDMGGMDIPVGAQPPPPPNSPPPTDFSPFYQHQLLEQGTKPATMRLDEDVDIDKMSPAERFQYGIPADAHGMRPMSLLKGGQSGTYALERAKIMANAMGLPSDAALYLAEAANGTNSGDALQHYNTDHPGAELSGKMAATFNAALARNAGQFNTVSNNNANRVQRQANQDENQAGKGAQAVDGNTILKTYDQRIGGGQNSLELIQKMRLPPNDPNYVLPSAQNLHQLANEIGKLETGSGSVAEGNLEKGELSNESANLTALANKWTGDSVPADIGNQLVQAEQLIHSLVGGYHQNKATILQQLAAGRGPKQAAAINAKIQAEHAAATAPQAPTYQGEMAKAWQKYRTLPPDQQAIALPRLKAYFQQNYQKDFNGQ